MLRPGQSTIPFDVAVRFQILSQRQREGLRRDSEVETLWNVSEAILRGVLWSSLPPASAAANDSIGTRSLDLIAAAQMERETCIRDPLNGAPDRNRTCTYGFIDETANS